MPFNSSEIWDFLFSGNGEKLWLDDAEKEFSTFKNLSYIRTKWKLKSWTNEATLQMRVIANKDKNNNCMFKMKNNMRHIIFLISVLLTFSNGLFAQQNQEPWSNSQLLEPAALASKIGKNQTDSLLILSVGPDAVIKALLISVLHTNRRI